MNKIIILRSLINPISSVLALISKHTLSTIKVPKPNHFLLPIDTIYMANVEETRLKVGEFGFRVFFSFLCENRNFSF